MRILVCISHVPDTTAKINFKDHDTTFDPTGVQFVLNPYDELALSKALSLAEQTAGSVTVIHVGESDAEATIRKALATGAHEAVRVNSPARDAWFVAKQIAQYATDQSFDLILTGSESIDYNGTQVADYLGELLQFPSVSIAKSLTIENGKALVSREIEGGKEVLEITLPIVIGAAEGLAEARIPNMRGIMAARTKAIQVIEPLAVEARTRMLQYEKPASRKEVTFINAGKPEELINILHQHLRLI